MDLEYQILDEDFNNKDAFRFMFYDGLNFAGSIYNGVDSRTYNNGDRYEKCFEVDDNHDIYKVTIKYYDKESDTTYCSSKEINKEIIYMKNDTSITKEEYEAFARNFIKKNSKSIIELIKNLNK